MFLKRIELPYAVVQYEAFSRRLMPLPARSEAKSLYKRGLAGFRGEQSLKYALSYLPEKEYSILHHLRLSDGKYYFEIDYLVLSARFFIILEVKNIAGKLTFDTDLLQLIREQGQTVDVFDDPLSQAKNLSRQISAWLRKPCGSLRIPLIERVVIASDARLDATDRANGQIKKIVRRANLKNELIGLDEKYTEKCITQGRLKKIADKLLAAHQERIVDPFSRFKINPGDVRHGVACPSCGAVPMVRWAQRWRCLSCGQVSRDAHFAALRDYYLIHGTAISSKRCQKFLIINAHATVNRWLHALSDHYTGEKKSRIYFLSWAKLNQSLNKQPNSTSE